MELVKMDKAPGRISSPRLCKMLNRAAKLIVCLVLCCALVFAYSYKEPVEVHATGVGVLVGSVVGILALSVLGINIGATVGNETCKDVLDTIWTNGIAKFGDQAAYVTEQGINIAPSLLTYIGNQFQDILDQNASAVDLMQQLPGKTIDFINPKMNYDWIKALFGLETFTTVSSIGYDFFAGRITDETILNGLWIVGTFDDLDVKNHRTVAMRFGTNVVFTGGTYETGGYISSNITLGDTTGFFKVQRYDYWPETNKAGLKKYILAIYQQGTEKGYLILCATDNGNSDQRVVTRISYVPVYSGGDQSYLLDKTKIIHDGKSVGVGENTPESVVEALKEKVGVTADDGTVTIPLINKGSKTDIDADNRTQTQAETAGADIATEADKAASEAANEGHDTSVPKPNMPDISLPKLITKKFPFSLPWDLYGAFKNLVAPAQAPKFVYPFELPRLGIHQSITIDFSGYGNLASISRWGFLLAFVVWLIVITRKMIGGGS